MRLSLRTSLVVVAVVAVLCAVPVLMQNRTRAKARVVICDKMISRLSSDRMLVANYSFLEPEVINRHVAIYDEWLSYWREVRRNNEGVVKYPWLLAQPVKQPKSHPEFPSGMDVYKAWMLRKGATALGPPPPRAHLASPR